MIIVLEENTGTIELLENVVTVYEVADFNIPPGINESLFTDAGQVIVSTSANTPATLNHPGADGLVLTSKPSDPKKMEWRAPSSGGGGGSLTNKRGSSVVVGNVVILHNDYDAAFTTTNVPNDARVIGVVADSSISNNTAGQILTVGKGTVLVQGNVGRGEWLVASSTDGRAKAAGYAKPVRGAIGIALEAYAGGGAGSVSAWVAVDPYLGASRGRGYVLGGYTTTYINNAQVVTYASETTALVSGANLSVARRYAAGVSGTNAGYAMGGYTGANSTVSDKVTFSTDTTAAQASANLSASRRDIPGVSGTNAGYAMGGYTTGAVVTTDKVVYSTDTTAAQASANCSVGRYSSAGVSGINAGYAMGGAGPTATTDKVVYSTDTTAAQASANCSVARGSLSGVSGINAGYAMGGTGPTATTDKVVYSTDTTAAQVSANFSLARYFACGLAGTLSGYAMGGNTGSMSAVADRITFSTDTTVAVSGANLPTSSDSHAGVFANV